MSLLQNLFDIFILFISKMDSQHQRSRSRNKQRQENKKGRPIRLKEDEQSSEESRVSEKQTGYKDEISVKIMDSFLDFFQSIGQYKGFIYSEIERKKFQTSSKGSKIKWTSRHEWNLETEISKIIKLLQLNNLDSKFQNLKELFLEVSGFFASQFTQELYTILIQILKINAEFELIDFQNKINVFATELMKNAQKYYLFGINFKERPRKRRIEKSEKSKILNSIVKQIMIDQQTRKQAYHKLIKELCAIMKDID